MLLRGGRTMKIFLLGANGRTGREVLRYALSDGDVVTALVRSEDRLADVSHRRLEIVVGDPCDPGVLHASLPGHDVVVSVLGPRLPTKAASAIYPESAAAIAETMRRSDVDRLLVTSSALLFPDAGLLAGLLRRLMPGIVQAARGMEERIRASGLDWTIVRTSLLTNDSELRCRVAPDALPAGGGTVSRSAVARFLLTEAKECSHLRQVVGLCG